MNLFQLSQDVEQYVIDMRREFHANPEISFQEKRTTARIREELDKIGIPHETVGSGNVVALFDTGRPGKSLAIRADIDALPMDEADKTTPYCSKVEGVMHSCGHDGQGAHPNQRPAQGENLPVLPGGRRGGRRRRRDC